MINFIKIMIPIIMTLMTVGCANENSIDDYLTNDEEIIISNVDVGDENALNEIILRVNDKELTIELIDNPCSKTLVQLLKKRDVVVEAKEYGNFEKVGNLGFTLPKEDKEITTEAGDLVLYQGNQISLFYNSNTWSYTKFGKVKDVTQEELKDILGDGDVTLTFSLK